MANIRDFFSFVMLAYAISSLFYHFFLKNQIDYREAEGIFSDIKAVASEVGIDKFVRIISSVHSKMFEKYATIYLNCNNTVAVEKARKSGIHSTAIFSVEERELVNRLKNQDLGMNVVFYRISKED